MQKPIELAPIRESTAEYEEIERRIKTVFRETVYLPILRKLRLPRKTIQNDKDALLRAIGAGRVYFVEGRQARFKGAFDAATTKQLKSLGAKWNRAESSFEIPMARLPLDMLQAIRNRTTKFFSKLREVEQDLAKNLPEKIAGSVQVKNLFDSTLWKVDRQLKQTLKGLTVPPQLTTSEADRITSEWQENMELWIKDFAEEEISKLRKDIRKTILAGGRYESIVGAIQRSYGVTERKAKFLARQETALLMTKFKETRYTSAGIQEYKWRNVAGSKLHPVRPSHKLLDGKIFRWDDPPITTLPSEPARRNNPGQDYNCRCAAIPIFRR